MSNASPIQYTTGAYVDSPSAHTQTQVYGSNNSAGSLLLAFLCWDTSQASTVSVADSRGNTWSQAAFFHDTTNGEAFAIWYAKGASAGANTVTATYGTGTQAAGFRGMICAEYGSTFVAADGNAGQFISFSGTIDSGTSGNWTTAHANDLVVGFVGSYNTTRTIFGGTGFTLQSSGGTTSFKFNTEDMISGSAGTMSSTFDASGSDSGVVLGAAFSAGGGSNITGTSAVALGSLAVAATGKRTRLGTSSVALGSLTASSTGKRIVLGIVASNLGALTASVTGKRTTIGSSAVSLGVLTLSASVHATKTGTSTVSLGSLTIGATGKRSTFGMSAVAFPALNVSATGKRVVVGVATFTFPGIAPNGTGKRSAAGHAVVQLGSISVSGIGSSLIRPHDGDAGLPMISFFVATVPNLSDFSASMPQVDWEGAL